MSELLTALTVYMAVGLGATLGISRIPSIGARGLTCLLVGFGIVVSPLFSFIGAIQWLAMTMLLVWSQKPTLGRVTLAYCLLAVATNGGFMLFTAVQQAYYQRKFPIVSFARRLAYETPPPGAGRMVERDLDTGWNFKSVMHRSALKVIHEDYTRMFIEASGFGNWRMMHIKLPDLDTAKPPRRQPAPEKARDPGTIPGLQPGETPAKPPWNYVSKFQDEAAEAFIGKFDRLYIKTPRTAVSGFTAHRFDAGYSSSEGERLAPWRLERLELVSLLKFKEPRVYRSENLPQMDELRDAPTRPLDEFESTALPKVRTGKQIVAEARGPNLRALGPLPYRNECGNCHHPPRDELLGAFSYRFGR
jgi:hypothetical protein